MSRGEVVSGGVRAWVYRPRRAPRGVWLVAPGLHYEGPADPRLDRFCRVLAHGGSVVVAPFLADFLGLIVRPSATADLARAFDVAARMANAERLPPPSIFSISFGSRPAIELAATETRARALVLFGGFCDFDATVRFAVAGAGDPLNAPVVYLHLLEHLGAEDAPRLGGALRRMVHSTWGRAELKAGRAREPIARRIADELGLRGGDRDLFFSACRLGPIDAGELLERGLREVGDAFAWIDPRPHLERVRVPVAIVHGRDDDVIPFTEAAKIAAALPPRHPHETILTGLYAHTGSSIPRPGAVLDEVRALARTVRILSHAPVAPRALTRA